MPSAARPFGLTMTTPLAGDDLTRLATVAYDEQRQVSVTADGTPLCDHPLAAVTTSARQTIQDMQEWPDYDPDD
ncbi:putative ATP-grasp target RiPP [Actinoalloteichus sp. GBA129-24]|uniref:ATP-grasp target RiPP n=2 Tax=Pseudonocardiaceae TaxID=2070 RepID=A0AAC9LHP4_9PSEU|nr:putative ATP-grasp target RiPP [Actinoalloteichus fjordicus]APU23624.1 putative ATP-grasp target RiPP [Actinoalloteichus sp. GBA129-24]